MAVVGDEMVPEVSEDLIADVAALMVVEVKVFGVTVVDETYPNKKKTKKTKQNKQKRDSYRIIDLNRNGDVIEAAYFDFVGIWLKLAFVTFTKATGLGAMLQCDVVQRST